MDNLMKTKLERIREYALAVLEGRIVLHDGPDDCFDSYRYGIRAYFFMILCETLLPGEEAPDIDRLTGDDRK